MKRAALLYKTYIAFAKKWRLQLALAALAALYFFSAPKAQKAASRALLNSKSEADKIELFEPGRGCLVLSKAGSFWLGEFLSEQSADDGRGGRNASDKKSLFFSCDSMLVEKLLYNLRKNVKVYEISDKKDAKNSFGLRQDRAFLIKIRRKSEVISSLNFGSVDSQNRIFFCVDNDTKIQLTDSAALAPYLTASADFWAAPEIFPKDIVGADKKWRHGKLAVAGGQALLADGLDWSGAAEKVYDAGDGNIYRACFLRKPDGDYWFRFEAQPSAQRPEEEKAALKKINAVFDASAWTFEKVFEED